MRIRGLQGIGRILKRVCFPWRSQRGVVLGKLLEIRGMGVG